MNADSLPDSLQSTLSFFDRSDPGTPWTTSEVAAAFDVGRRSIYARLDRLVEAGFVETKKVGARGRVWWRPPAADETGDSSTPGVEWDQKLRSLVEATEEYAMFVLDADGFVQTWNPGAARIKGYDRADIVGEHVSTFYTEADRRAGVPERNLETALAEGSVEDEGWRLRADGTPFWANVTITAIRDDEGVHQGFAKVTRDMTERHEYERALEREKDLVEQILETSPTGIAILGADGSVEHVNRRAWELLGVSADEADEFHSGERELLDDDGDPRYEATASAFEAFETGEPVYDREVEIETDDGSRWLSINATPLIDESGDVDRVVTTGTDVTQLKEQGRRLAQRLDELESELEEVFARVSDAFYGLDEELRFTYVNDRAEALLGVDESAVIGTKIHDAVPLTDRFEDALHEALEDRNAVSFADYYEPLDGWYENSFYPSATGVSVYFRDVTERKQRELELERYEAIFEAANDGVYTVDPVGRFVTVNEAYVEMTGYDREELLGEHVSLVADTDTVDAADAREDRLLDGDGEVGSLEAELRRKDGTTFPAEATFALVNEGADDFERIGVVRDVTDRKERERELERQRERLAALDTLNGIVRQINETVIEKSTRTEIEQVVVDALAGVDSYEFAWVGDVDSATGAIDVRCEAGTEGGLADLVVSVDPDDPRGAGPTGRAFRTGELQVVHDAGTDPWYEPWRDAVEEMNYRSSAAIPIVHEGTVYGVLNVYADRRGAFASAEREVIGQLGEIVGHAIAAVERKRALMSDEMVELDFQLRDFFGTLGIDATPDGAVTIDQMVPIGDDSYLVYGTTTGDGLAIVEELVASDSLSHWTSMDVLWTDGDETRVKVELTDPPVLSLVASHGGYVRDATIDHGDYGMRIHLAPSADVRHVSETIRETYPGIEMLSRRQRTRTDSSIGHLEQMLDGALTDRQRTALATAYHSGFFEWPRERTGEDVADSIGISPPTFHQHLRKAQRKLLATIFESRA